MTLSRENIAARLAFSVKYGNEFLEDQIRAYGPYFDLQFDQPEHNADERPSKKQKIDV